MQILSFSSVAVTPGKELVISLRNIDESTETLWTVASWILKWSTKFLTSLPNTHSLHDLQDFKFNEFHSKV